MDETLHKRINDLIKMLECLLNSEVISFSGNIRSLIPENQGVYRIFEKNNPKSTLRAGRNRNAKGGLRQRIYQNHLQGNQSGNLRAQLVKSGLFENILDAKEYIKSKCAFQYLIIENEKDRIWFEHFLLAILQPDFSD